MQHTIAHPVEITGIGLHSGEPVRMRVLPAAPDEGVYFIRTDLSSTENDSRIPALWHNVRDTMLCTEIVNAQGAKVGTIEHLMAAFRACDIDNARIEIDGPEVPILDGSSLPFILEIDRAGLRAQNRARKFIRILKTVTLVDGDKSVSLSPSAESVFSAEIDFPHPCIGRQRYSVSLDRDSFYEELANCRTFGFEREIEMLQAAGKARGGSLDNAVVFGKDKILNPDGLIRPDEPVRHKLLDAVGDLYMAGMPILGAYHGIRGGHDMNNRLVHKLFETREAWYITESGCTEDDAITAACPGVSSGLDSFACAQTSSP